MQDILQCIGSPGSARVVHYAGSLGSEPFDFHGRLPSSPLMAPEPLLNTGGLTVRLPFPSLPQTSTNEMAQNDQLPLVFKFGEVDSEPDEIETKEE